MSEGRGCGMLLPIASLPSRYGIGSFSKEAYEFIDTLQRAGQQYWQILPLGPTGYGDSPYQSFSAFAGNPYFIDLGTLVEEGLLTENECEAVDFGDNPIDIDYEKIYKNRFPLLQTAYGRWKEGIQVQGGRDALQELTEALEPETREYCFYMAVKNHFGGKSWIEWEDAIKRRKPEAVMEYRERLAEEIGFCQFQQMKFKEQWKRLKDYANKKGIRIIGDIPIYVAFDSADSWVHPELFQFDENNLPKAVAGCPPDGFSSTGQLWGNPLYRWEYHEQTDFSWWMVRMQYSFQLYDVVRVDHFRGFDEYYAIPFGDTTAQYGRWEKGPGMGFFHRLKHCLGSPDIIAEDLGYLTPSVLELVKESGFPGMKVLEFAFCATDNSPYLPHKYSANYVVYTGTHDNDTLKSWFLKLNQEDRRLVFDYIGCREEGLDEIHWDFIRLALASVARVAVIPVQDYLGLGNEARINEPSTLGKNWRWRMQAGQLTEEIEKRCLRMTQIFGRTADMW